MAVLIFARSKTRLLRDPQIVFGLVFLGAAVARSLWLATPRGALIFDENFYVNAARVILGRHVADGHEYAGAIPGIDPNSEHPPLGKLLIAGSMRIFGDNAFGWRLPSLIAGMLAIVLVYAIVRAAGGDRWLATLAATIFSFDNLVLVHSRIATLDMMLLAFMLLGVWCWLRGWRLAAGAVLGIAGLVKLGAIYGLAALVLVEIGTLLWERARKRTWSLGPARAAAKMMLGFGVVWLAGLWVLDLAFTTYNYPWDHLRHMLDYGFSIKRPGGPANTESNPWQWLANDVQIDYIRVTENLSVGGKVTATRNIIDFRGAMNPVVIGVAPLAVTYAAARAWRLRDRLSIWVVAWVLLTYGAFYPLALISHRTMYIFYILPTLPAVAIATAQLLRQAALPRLLTWGYLLGLAVVFLDYYPFRRIPPG